MVIFHSYVSLPEGMSFHSVGNVIIPTDVHIFQRDWNRQPVIVDRQKMNWFILFVVIDLLFWRYLPDRHRGNVLGGFIRRLKPPTSYCIWSSMKLLPNHSSGLLMIVFGHHGDYYHTIIMFWGGWYRLATKTRIISPTEEWRNSPFPNVEPQPVTGPVGLEDWFPPMAFPVEANRRAQLH